jgi:hypothetical protein
MSYSPDTEWPVEYTDEFEKWWESLTEAEQEDVAAKVILLQRLGPALPRPHSDVVRSSRYANMKELRIQHAGRPYRVLYSAARNVGYTVARGASFAGKALALAGDAARSRPSPRPLPRGAGRRPSSDSPPDCAVQSTLSPLLGTAQYAFDPRRCAILLIGGDKTGNDRWYETFVPMAERLYDEHMASLRGEGLIDG